MVTRGVFDPVRHLSGIAFADQLADVIAECAPDAQTALDLGTGCGLLAATLGQLGLQVVATDISTAAVECATENCYGLPVEVRPGDLFAPVQGQTFDLLVVNPPYGRARPTWRTNATLSSPDFLERFGAQASDFASTIVLGFPAKDAAVLTATGLDFQLWRTVPTSGHDLGLFIATTS